MKSRAKKTKPQPMQPVILATAIAGVKADRGNRKALTALANAYNVPLDSVIVIAPKNAKTGKVRADGKQTKNGGHYSFGQIAECIIRLGHGLSGQAQPKGAPDIIIDGQIYEIKATSSDGKPTQTKGLEADTPTLIFANITQFQRGIYKIPYGAIVWNNSTTPHMVNVPTLERAQLIRAI